jgi:hypothetical protein
MNYTDATVAVVLYMHIPIASKCVFNFSNVTDLLLHFLQIQSDKVTFWLSLHSQQLPSVIIK